MNMLDNNSQPWIRLIQKTDEHYHNDPHHPTEEIDRQEDNKNLEDRVELLEQIIIILRKEIKELNRQLSIYRGIDISVASNIDFWLSEEDDVWDTL